MVDLGALLDDLVRDEEFRAFLYDDATGKPIKKGSTLVGNPTIGIGWNLASDGLSAQEARLHDLEKITTLNESLGQAFPWYNSLDPARQRVLLEMGFNLGLVGLEGFHLMMSALSTKNYPEASNQMLASHWREQVGDRALRLAQIMRYGV